MPHCPRPGPTDRHLSVPALLATAAVAWTLVPASPGAAAQFSEADIFFELNATDRDVGVHVALDAQSWRQVGIDGPNGRTIDITPRGSLAVVGLTELFFEGEEPSLDEVPFSQFLLLVPQGIYVFTGVTTGGQVLRSSDKLTTALPCPVALDEPEADDQGLVIVWQPAPGTFNPDTENCDSQRPVQLVAYELVVEVVDRQGGLARVLSMDLPPDATRARVPAEFLEGAQALKVELLAIESSGNRTITEREL
jgi:hypothetical protein